MSDNQYCNDCKTPFCNACYDDSVIIRCWSCEEYICDSCATFKNWHQFCSLCLLE